MGKNVHVEFGATADEVLVWSDFAACLKVWCLRTGRAVEIRDPKFPGKENRGWAYRPSGSSKHGRGQVMALLCRTSGVDVLLLLSAQTYTILSRVELPTLDAANLKWSRDGRWLAVWDAASTGYHLHIYTADGNLYRTITREPSDDLDAWGIEGLGIRSVEWLPGNEKLAVGGWDRRVRILSTRTFAPVVFLDHTPVIHVPDAPVYTEHIDGQGNRSYMPTPQPATPPKPPLEKNESALMKQGISLLMFNADATLCATRDDASPSTPPAILDFEAHIAKPATSVPARWHVSWLPSPSPSSSKEDKKPLFLLAHQHAYILVWPAGKDKILRFEREQGEESDDSLFEILTGRREAPRLSGGVELDRDREEEQGLDDTFRGKGGRREVGGEEGGGLGESGMSEMF
ncbi:hypothetical protein SNOG_01919 [Parastagonospora nodorum SN15]|uniref:Anaphase-promoting complex subunit 4 WD40 domain-containing protein n=1 Tax=Phaeosphaeria nodorum (strain SN15 / ATCC MYA-4574 / FGSC 10173) TaxID=321614 RepID=Q0V245_PHANO|nr:hypothetical protein SNOG_01919 [Parastagonospora nodorum SN15]EAT90131.2 hypothetical protein SNOG_01919 [Parastagonospora nodorum SN15]